MRSRAPDAFKCLTSHLSQTRTLLAWVAQVVADFTPKTRTAPPDFLVFS
jgi:hypothetical protein